MKKLKLFVTTMLAMFVATVSVHAACNVAETGAEASIVTGSTVKYCDSVKDAVTNANANDTVKLLKQIDFADGNYLNRIDIASKDITFDFNGNKIIATNLPSEYAAFVVSGTSEVTFVGKGGIENKSGSSALLVTGTANVTIEGGEFIKSGNSTDGKSYSAVTVFGGSTLTVEEKGEAAVLIKGGILVSGNQPKLYFKNGTIDSDDDFAISGNGRDTTDSEIEISGGTLKSAKSAAIYHPQTGTLNIKGGNITGAIGIVARQGDINITSGNITATGTGEDIRVGDAKKGDEYVLVPQGVAVIVDNSEEGAYNTDPAEVNIEKGEFNVPKGKEAVLDYENPGAKKIKVSGGTFNVDVEKEYLASNDLGQSESGKVGKLHKVEITKTENGKVEAYTNAAEGEEVVVKITADKGYQIDSVTITDKDGKTVKFLSADGGIRFTMPTSDVKVTVTFKKVETPVVTPETTETTEEENPKTGDNIFMYLSLGLASVAVASLSVKKLRKTN